MQPNGDLFRKQNASAKERYKHLARPRKGEDGQALRPQVNGSYAASSNIDPPFRAYDQSRPPVLVRNQSPKREEQSKTPLFKVDSGYASGGLSRSRSRGWTHAEQQAGDEQPVSRPNHGLGITMEAEPDEPRPRLRVTNGSPSSDTDSYKPPVANAVYPHAGGRRSIDSRDFFPDSNTPPTTSVQFNDKDPIMTKIHVNIRLLALVAQLSAAAKHQSVVAHEAEKLLHFASSNKASAGLLARCSFYSAVALYRNGRQEDSMDLFKQAANDWNANSKEEGDLAAQWKNYHTSNTLSPTEERPTSSGSVMSMTWDYVNRLLGRGSGSRDDGWKQPPRPMDHPAHAVAVEEYVGLRSPKGERVLSFNSGTGSFAQSPDKMSGFEDEDEDSEKDIPNNLHGGHRNIASLPSPQADKDYGALGHMKLANTISHASSGGRDSPTYGSPTEISPTSKSIRFAEPEETKTAHIESKLHRRRTSSLGTLLSIATGSSRQRSAEALAEEGESPGLPKHDGLDWAGFGLRQRKPSVDHDFS